MSQGFLPGSYAGNSQCLQSTPGPVTNGVGKKESDLRTLLIYQQSRVMQNLRPSFWLEALGGQMWIRDGRHIEGGDRTPRGDPAIREDAPGEVFYR